MTKRRKPKKSSAKSTYSKSLIRSRPRRSDEAQIIRNDPPIRSLRRGEGEINVLKPKIINGVKQQIDTTTVKKFANSAWRELNCVKVKQYKKVMLKKLAAQKSGKAKTQWRKKAAQNRKTLWEC